MSDLIPTACPVPAFCEPGNGIPPTTPAAIGEPARAAVTDGGSLPSADEMPPPVEAAPPATLSASELLRLRQDILPMLRFAAHRRIGRVTLAEDTPSNLYLTYHADGNLSVARNDGKTYVSIGPDLCTIEDFAAWLDTQVTP